MLYDIRCTATALLAAAAWAYADPASGGAVALARDGGSLTCRQGDRSASFDSGGPEVCAGVSITLEALAAAAAWAEPQPRHGRRRPAGRRPDAAGVPGR